MKKAQLVLLLITAGAFATVFLEGCSMPIWWYTVIHGVAVPDEAVVKIAGLEVEISRMGLMNGYSAPVAGITIRNTTMDTVQIDLSSVKLIFIKDSVLLAGLIGRDEILRDKSGLRPITPEVLSPDTLEPYGIYRGEIRWGNFEIEATIYSIPPGEAGEISLGFSYVIPPIKVTDSSGISFHGWRFISPRTTERASLGGIALRRAGDVYFLPAITYVAPGYRE